MAKYKIISVQGESVRVAFGCATVDFRILRRPDGTKYLEKPSNLYVHPHLFNELVRAAFQAYKQDRKNGQP